MSVRQCVPLDSLDESSEGCRIQARVVTIWECNNSERFLQTIGLNLKLLDVEEYCVEAYIPPRTVKKFKSVLEEGQTYEICNFSVSKYSVDFKLRACNKPIYILFREDTKVLAGDKDCQLIPKNIFDFLMLKDVRQCKGYNNRLLDIVGLIGFIEPLSISTNDHGIEEKCIEFGITDGINIFQVFLTDAICDEFLSTMKEFNDESTIIILQSCILQIYDGEYTFTSHPSSRFVVNCQSEIVEHLTNRLFSIADTHSNKGRKVHTISEIISRENLNPEENVYIQGKIVSISENDSWYFLQCNQCGGEVLDNLAKWRCNYCKIKIPMPDKRFHLPSLSVEPSKQAMSIERYDSLSSLDSGTYDWKVKVRISRNWKSVQKATGELRGYNMILVDDQASRKHAFVGEAYAKKFEDSLIQGQIYVIENFNVKPYTEKEKHQCFKDDTHIFFSSYTHTKTVEKDDKLSPENVFGFYDISELGDIANQNVFLIDVIGYVENVENPRHFTNKNNEAQSYVKFDLSDGCNIVKVTLWDSFGNMFYEDYNKFKKDPTILIISSCKVNIWESILSLSNYPATKYFFNYKHHSVNILLARHKEPGFCSTQRTVRIEVPVPKITVAELKHFIPQNEEMNVLCDVTIMKIKDKESWFYSICCGCCQEIEKVDGKYKCEKCNKIEPYPESRFRVCTYAADETGGIGIVLYDREVQRVIGKTVFEIQWEQMQNVTIDQFPSAVMGLENVTCTITLGLKKAQSANKTNIFHAVDIMLNPSTECNSPSSQGDTYIQQQASVTLGSVSQVPKSRSKKTPDTLKSTSKSKSKKKSIKMETDVNLSDDEDTEHIPLSKW
ncbi:hypothetical protein DCAR_0623480 [Daucus carota subsp. sativus]|uniref:Uncharacterized protein n=1 Tax=Daucus carota subsp. sativus TaxID=79200 RepID=A0A175YBK1_DAUCS|nr:hypothetical protein DCAR_0623480 [Daucus carota subsp. sativus]